MEREVKNSALPNRIVRATKSFDKGVKGHVTAWCATKLYKSQKLTSTICMPLKSLSNGSAQLIVVDASMPTSQGTAS
jgi:hypothetical protein